MIATLPTRELLAGDRDYYVFLLCVTITGNIPPRLAASSVRAAWPVFLRSAYTTDGVLLVQPDDTPRLQTSNPE